MNTNQTLNKVRTLLGIEVKFEQAKLGNGAVLEAETFEVGAEIFVVADEEKVALPIGEYILEDGQTIVVAEEGVIAEIKEAGAEEEEEAPSEEEAPAEEVVEEEELSTETATPKKVIESISKETFFSEIEKLRNEIEALKLSKVEEVVVEEKVELSEVEGINHNPEAITEKKELNLYSQKGKNSIQSRIFNKLNK